MSITLLVDLDDTLLINNTNRFLPAYLNAFCGFVAEAIEPDVFMPAILHGTEMMIKNLRPDRTLQQVWDADFFAAVDIDPQEFYGIASTFYEDEFPKLRHLTGYQPEAREFIESALERGYRMAVTTNPLFPITAINQRIGWAGLSDLVDSFELVTSFEDFHFSKPNPAFYAEVLGHLGWPDEAVLVVGDDLERDIHAGAMMGLATYWIAHASQGRVKKSVLADGTGGINAVLPWLDGMDPDQLIPDYEIATAMSATLRSTPAVIDSLMNSRKGISWTSRPAEDEWCPTEIVCHLRDVDRDVNLPRVKHVLKETNPFLSAEDTDRWAEERDYICQDSSQALQEFIELRLALLDILSDLSEGDWQRPARHSIFGRTNLGELVSIITGHDRLHIKQLTTSLDPSP